MNQTTQPVDLAGYDADLMAKWHTRPVPNTAIYPRRTCFFCSWPLQDGVCARCDRPEKGA